MAGEEIYQVIGFLLEAKDLATPAVLQAQAALGAAVPQVERLFNNMVTSITLGMDTVEKGVTGTADAFRNVTHDFVTAPMEIFVHAVANFADTVGTKLEGVAETLQALPGKVKGALKVTADFLKKDRTFVDFYKFIGDQTVRTTQLIGKGLVGSFELLKRRIGDTGVQLGSFLRSGNALDKLSPIIKGIGSAFSFAMGPFGLLFKLLSPFLNMIERALAPALETFSDILENAFAPLSFVAETIARDLAPLIAKFLQPFINLLTVGLARLGTFLVKFLDTGKAAGGLSGIFAKFQPILGKILETFGKLFEAVVPLIEPLLHLGQVLLEKVFAPLLLKSLEGIVLLIETLIPYIEEGIPVAVQLINDMSDSIVDFFDNFARYMKQFYDLFIAPIVDGFGEVVDVIADSLVAVGNMFADAYKTVGGWLDKLGTLISDSWDAIVDGLGLDGIAAGAGRAFDALLAAVMSPLATIKSFINDWIIAPLDSLLSADIPIIGKFSDILNKLPGVSIKTPLPKLAKGGILNQATPVIAGEAGPEAILPLNKETFDNVMPGLDEAVDVLRSILRAVTGTLTVRNADGVAQGGSARAAAPPSDLGAAVGLKGLARV